MRLAVFAPAAVLLGAALSTAQPPAAANPDAATARARQLDDHLAKWEAASGKLTNFRLDASLKRTDVVFKREKAYSGSVLCMKPNLSRLRLSYDGDKTGADYEAYICNGKEVYAYSGLEKTVTKWKLPPRANNAPATDNLLIDFLFGMKAKDAKERFDLSYLSESEHYVYLEAKSVLAKDKAEFTVLRVALFGPKMETPYLPAQVFLVKPNGDTEQWMFTKPETNLKGIEEKNFQYEAIKGWTLVEAKAPMAPAQPKK